jgi:Domain of unknown function (DUF4158)
MSTDDDLPETICPRWRLVLPAEPSEDELARHWSLTPADLIEIGRCRGDDHRRRFALQLCMLRTHGRFLEDYRQAPLRIVNHLSRQIGLAPVLFLDRPGRGQTERAQALRIRRYLGLKSFDRKAEEDLRDWLRQGALEGRSTTELLVRVEGRLRDWRIMLPAPGTLQRIVTSEVARATASLFDKVAAQLPASLREAIDLLLEMPEGDARSSLFRLKDAPRSATAAAIKGDIVRLCLIEQLLGDGVGLEGVDPKVIRQLGQLGRRYDAGDLRRFAKPKRDALVVCTLVEARKSLLDQLVEMSDQFLTGMNRRANNTVKAQQESVRRRAQAGMDRVLGAVEALADGDQTVTAFRQAVDAPALVAAVAACRAFARLEERGHLDAMLARYATLRQYLPAFITLPFQAAVGSEPLMAAITILRALDAGMREGVDPDDPCGFVPAALPHRKRQGRPADLGDLPGTGGSRRAQGRQPVPGGKPRPCLVLEPDLRRPTLEGEPGRGVSPPRSADRSASLSRQDRHRPRPGRPRRGGGPAPQRLRRGPGRPAEAEAPRRADDPARGAPAA